MTRPSSRAHLIPFPRIGGDGHLARLAPACGRLLRRHEPGARHRHAGDAIPGRGRGGRGADRAPVAEPRGSRGCPPRVRRLHARERRRHAGPRVRPGRQGEHGHPLRRPRPGRCRGPGRDRSVRRAASQLARGRPRPPGRAPGRCSSSSPSACATTASRWTTRSPAVDPAAGPWRRSTRTTRPSRPASRSAVRCWAPWAGASDGDRPGGAPPRSASDRCSSPVSPSPGSPPPPDRGSGGGAG